MGLGQNIVLFIYFLLFQSKDPEKCLLLSGLLGGSEGQVVSL